MSIIIRGLTFREAFARVGEIRAMSLNQPLMALTATATSDLRIKVQEKLGMVNPLLLLKSPDKTNITLVNAGIKNDYERAFQPILAELITKRTKLPRIIIYCKKKQTVVHYILISESVWEENLQNLLVHQTK